VDFAGRHGRRYGWRYGGAAGRHVRGVHEHRG
jgi:hypothetical protein